MELTEENFFSPDYQPLAKAVRQGNLTDIDEELSRGLNVNVVGKEDMTLLMWAIVNKNKASLAHLLKKGEQLQPERRSKHTTRGPGGWYQ